MKKYILIEGDTNDGDYIEESCEISDEDLVSILPVIGMLSERKINHNWQSFEGSDESPYKMYVVSGIITEEQYDIFYEYVPHGEHGIHSITSILVLEVVNETKFL